MPSAAEERLRGALREKLERAVSYHGRSADYATVIAIDPLRVELHDEGHTIEEDEDLTLGHEVRQYIADYGDLQPADDDGDDGDTLVVHRMADGDWVAISVLHDSDVTPSGGGPTMRAAAPGRTEVTELPESPADGAEVYLEVDSAGRYGGPLLWLLRHDATDQVWIAVGATPLYAEGDDAQIEAPMKGTWRTIRGDSWMTLTPLRIDA